MGIVGIVARRFEFRQSGQKDVKDYDSKKAYVVWKSTEVVSRKASKRYLLLTLRKPTQVEGRHEYGPEALSRTRRRRLGINLIP